MKNITFSNPRASGEQFLVVEWSYTHDKPEFYVDGASIPLVDWDVGPSWAGLLPISNKTDETRQVRDSLERLSSAPGSTELLVSFGASSMHQLFFWFFPPGPEGSLDDLIFWCATMRAPNHLGS